MADLISREDALAFPIRIDHYDEEHGNLHFVLGIETVMEYIENLPSAEAEPTVIRSKTLMPTKDFKEWAKRIREENPNAVIIPCDAEVVSAEATCATCADRAMCIMSDDGNWKACKDYRPSAEADSDDLIIKGAKGIKDGLYNIKDGKLFKYKAKGGTVRTYEIVPSAEAVKGEWIDIDDYYRMATCSHCHKVTMFEKWGEYTRPYNYCPNCGAKMTKGGDNE